MRDEDDEVERLVDELTPIEKYALEFLQSTLEPEQLEQIKLQEEEIEASKKEWELEMMKRRLEQEARETDSGDEDVITMSREAAINQVFITSNGAIEHIVTWAPPTPPQENEADVYFEPTIGFLYEQSIMPDHQSELPPIYVPTAAKKLFPSQPCLRLRVTRFIVSSSEERY